MSAPYRPMPTASTVVGSGDRAAAAGSASASPPDTSSGGKIPCASERSSTIAACTSPLISSIIATASRGSSSTAVVGETQLDGEGDEMLLGAVVEVAFELAPLGVAGGDDAGA